jgi:hypothetical protein
MINSRAWKVNSAITSAKISITRFLGSAEWRPIQKQRWGENVDMRPVAVDRRRTDPEDVLGGCSPLRPPLNGDLGHHSQFVGDAQSNREKILRFGSCNSIALIIVLSSSESPEADGNL